MTDISIDESALKNMESLLGEQFPETLAFCCAELERLASEVIANLGQDKEAAIRNAHSLKSNAAQFGAISLAEVARLVEYNLNNANEQQAVDAVNRLMAQVTGSQAKLNAWLAQR